MFMGDSQGCLRIWVCVGGKRGLLKPSACTISVVIMSAHIISETSVVKTLFSTKETRKRTRYKLSVYQLTSHVSYRVTFFSSKPLSTNNVGETSREWIIVKTTMRTEVMNWHVYCTGEWRGRCVCNLSNTRGSSSVVFFTLQPLLQNLLFPTTAVSLSGTVLLTLIHWVSYSLLVLKV